MKQTNRSILTKILMGVLIIVALLIAGLFGYVLGSNRYSYIPRTYPCINCVQALKPIIYLYPQTTQKVNVKLTFDGFLENSYPLYDNKSNGWNVIAQSDGNILNTVDGKQYSYLFWDGVVNNYSFDLNKGFVVEGKDTTSFLQDKLSQMGLTEKEYNDFIVFWLPKMQNNKYNLIHFAGDEYTNKVNLEVSPKPDSLLRVYMVFKPLDNNIKVEPQYFSSFQRKGFTVVEWGGSELSK